MTNELVMKISKAGLSVGGKLSADKTNKEQRYDYISADKILSVCGQALFEQGVVVIPEINQQTISVTEYTNQYGKDLKRFDAVVDCVMTITDGENSLVAKWAGMGSDYSAPDKALYKAITSGHKYYLMKLLNVGAGNEDGEHELPQEPPARQERKPAKTNGNAPAPAVEYPPELAVVTNSDGELYINLPTDTLAHMANGITKALKKPGVTDDQAANYAAKFDAINQILALRNS